MVLDDLFRDRQAKPCTILLGGEKRPENVFQIRFFNPTPGVHHIQCNIP